MVLAIKQLWVNVLSELSGMKENAENYIHECGVIVDLASQFGISPRIVWTWYNVIWQGTIEGFITECAAAQRYAEAEGLDVHDVMCRRLEAQ